MESPSRALPRRFKCCELCQKRFNVPKQLPCRHTFCKQCLENYISDEDTSADDTQLGFPCPSCHKHTKPAGVDSDSCPMSEWPDLFPDNPLVGSLLQSLSIQENPEADDNDVTCALHPSNSLKYFCDHCQIPLCDQCSMADHGECTVEDLHEKDIADLCLIYHEKVTGEISALQSKLHYSYQALLPEQRKVYTKKEQTALEISKYFSEIRYKVNEQLLQQEQTLQKQLSAAAQNVEESISEHVTQCSSFLEAVDSKDQLVQELATREHGQTSKTRNVAYFQVLNQIDVQLQEYRNAAMTLDRERTSNCTMKFINDTDAENSVLSSQLGRVQVDQQGVDPTSHHEGEGHKHSSSDKHYRRKENRSSTPVSENVNPECKVHIPESQAVPTAPPADIDDPPPPYEPPAAGEFSEFVSVYDYTRQTAPLSNGNLVSSFRSLSPDDSRTCSVVGLFWMKSEHLIVVDRWNAKVKYFHESGTLLEDMVFRGGEPWGATKMSSTMIAVTMPKGRTICTIEVPTQGKMSLCSTRHTERGYACITYDPVKVVFICGCVPQFGPPCVDILKTNFSLLRSFAVGSSGPLFSYPKSISVTDEGILIISDWNKNQLTFMRDDGLIMGEYTGSHNRSLKDPMGLTIDPKTKTVFVADKRSGIHMVSIKGQFLGLLSLDTPIRDPRELCYVPVGTNAKIAVAEGNGVVMVYTCFKGN